MTEREFQKALLLTRIDAHRTVFRLELRAARATLNPVEALLGLFGLDRSFTELALAIMHLVTAHSDASPEDADVAPAAETQPAEE